MLLGSFRLLIWESGFHFSFFIDGYRVFIYLKPLCDGLISHQGQSVSSNNLSRGICLTTAKFSSVLRELHKIHTAHKKINIKKKNLLENKTSLSWLPAINTDVQPELNKAPHNV